MNCSKARFLLYAFLDRELTRADGEDLQRHLSGCPPCAARGRSARGLNKVLRTRLDYARAPIALRERLHAGMVTPHTRPRYTPLVIAASILLLILPLVADQRGPRMAASLAGTVAVTAPGMIPVSRKMTGTFVCLQCESRVCPTGQPVHQLGFCADNGETFRVMSADPELTTNAVGQTVTVEGVAFPESGFLRASRVGY